MLEKRSDDLRAVAAAVAWIPPADIGSPEPGPHTCAVGAFTALAWDDGYWAIAFAEDGEHLTECHERAPDLATAKQCVLTRVRGLVLVSAEALGLLRIEVIRG